jgi:hypothetical protein
MSHIETTSRSGRALTLGGPILLVAVAILGAVAAIADPFTLIFYGTHALLATLLIIRRPRQVIGWLLLVIAFGFIGTTSEPDVDVPSLLAGTATWPDFLAAWISSWSGYATFTAYAALLLVFPSGQFEPGAGGRIGRVLVGIGITLTVLVAVAPEIGFNLNGGTTTIVVPNRLAVLPQLAVWSAVPLDMMIAPVVAVLVTSLILTLRRYRRATGVAQLQLRWLVAAFCAVVLGVVSGLAISVVASDLGGLVWIPAILAYPTVPLAIYVAVTRYRLYEIDRIISRTISWALTTGLVAAVFGLLIVGLQALLAPLTSGSTLVVAGSTLAAAALFQPLYRRVQAAVDRRFNRRRVDAQRALDTFGSQLRDEVDLQAVSGLLVGAAGQAVQPSSVGLWTRGMMMPDVPKRAAG